MSDVFGEGRVQLKGTSTIVDTRDPGQFKPIEGMDDAFFDPVTGNFLDRSGSVLARDKFDFERTVAFPEKQRQFDITTRGGALSAAAQTQLGLDQLLTTRGVEEVQQPRLGQTAAAQGELGLAQLLDERINAAITARADPGNFVEAEFLSRALQPPDPSIPGPRFEDPVSLRNVLAKLAATPAPTFNDTTGLEEIITSLTGLGAGAVDEPTLTRTGATPTAAPTEPTLANVEQPPVIRPDDPGRFDTLRALGVSEADISALMAVSERQAGATRPEAPATSPTLANVAPPPTTQGVGAGLADPAFAEEIRRFQLANPGVTFAHGGKTDGEPFIAGDPQVAGVPNPELIIPGKGGDKVIPLNSLRHLAFGTEFGAPASQTDRTIQQLPSLRFLRGETTPAEFGQLATGTTPGAFGTQLPEAGGVNLRQLFRLAESPISTSLISSLLRSGSRTLEDLISRVRARAPVGQAVSTSMIRT